MKTTFGVVFLVFLSDSCAFFAPSRMEEFRWRLESQTSTELPLRRWGKPIFSNETLSQATVFYRMAGTSVKLLCECTGLPEPLTEWRKNQKLLEYADQRSIGDYDFDLRDNSLNMRQLTAVDSGNYSCTVSNKHGKIKRWFDLRVIIPGFHEPLIIQDSCKRNFTGLLNDSLSLTCAYISGSSPFEVRWVKHYQVNGRWEDRFSRIQFVKIVDLIPNPPPKQVQLKLNVLRWRDSGWYSCHVQNELGTGIADFWVTVTDKIPINESALVVERSVEGGRELFSLVAGLCLFGVIILLIIAAVIMFRKCRRRSLMCWCCGCWLKRRKPPLPTSARRIEIEPRPSTSEVSAPSVRIVSPGLAYDLLPTVFNEVTIPLDSNWEIRRSQVELLSVIGSGEFGEVWIGNYWRTVRHPGHRKPADFQVAVKSLKSVHNESDLMTLLSEMEVMKQIWRKQGGHENIVNLIGCCTQDFGPVMFLMDLCRYGNLRDFLRSRRPQKLAELGSEAMEMYLTLDHLILFAAQVAKGMEFLESCRCLHRDLAARNVMIDEKPTKNPLVTGYVAKVGDFGLAKRLFDKDYYHRRNAGRLPVKWMAPECFIDRTFSFPSDVWSYGILLYEIMTMGGSPYPAVHDPHDVFTYISSGARNTQPIGCPNSLYTVMSECWRINPHERPSFRQLKLRINQLQETINPAQLSRVYFNSESLDQDYLEADQRKVMLKCASAPAFTDYLLLLNKR